MHTKDVRHHIPDDCVLRLSEKGQFDSEHGLVLINQFGKLKGFDPRYQMGTRQYPIVRKRNLGVAVDVDRNWGIRQTDLHRL